jgi:hypothetical protein
MKKTITILTMVFLSTLTVSAKTITVKINNKTEQLITQLDYWLGSSTESNGAGIAFSSKGTLQIGSDVTFPVDFHKTKRNTLLVRGYLTGGGYVSQRYTISEGENPVITIYNIAVKPKTDELKRVMEKFTELKLSDGNYVKTSKENGIDAYIGAIYIYNGEDIIYKIAPGVLKTKIRQTSQPSLNQKITGIFSSETSVDGKLNLPFVSASSAFSSGDIAKFSWEIEDVGEYNWSSEDGKDLAELFTKLPQETKNALIKIYENYPNARMKFLDKAFVIGRLEVTTFKSKKIATNIELNGANYVTANGNYLFVDDLKDEFILKDVITEVSGYDATILLKSLYLDYKTQNNIAMKGEEHERIKQEYNFLRNLYPEYLQETSDVNIMKKALADLANDPKAKISFIKSSLKNEQIKINTIPTGE